MNKINTSQYEIKTPLVLGIIWSLLFLSFILYWALDIRTLGQLLRVCQYPFLWLIIIFLYWWFSFINCNYKLYSDKLIVTFPLRFVYRKYEIPLKNIEYIDYRRINTLGVPSSFNIFLTDHKKKRYSFSYRGDEKKMEFFLDKMNEAGVQIKP